MDDTTTVADPAIKTAIAEYSPTTAALAELRQRFANVAFDLSTTAGDKEARAARMELVRLRTSLEAKRKELKAPALERSRLIDDEAKRITGAILELEAPIDQQIKADEQKKEAERLAKIEAERQRVFAIRERIEAIGSVMRRAFGKPAAEIEAKIKLLVGITIGDDYAEFAESAEAVRADTLDKMREMHAAALEAEAEAKRLADERAEFERARAEQAERDRVHRERIAAEQARIAAEQRAESERLEVLAEAQRKRLAAEEAAARAEREAADRAAREKRIADDLAAAKARMAEQHRLNELAADLRRQAAEAEAARIAAQQAEQAAMTHPNGAPMYGQHIKENGDRVMLDEHGKRSIFCDVDEVAGDALPVDPVVAPEYPLVATPEGDKGPSPEEPASLALDAICARLGFNVSAQFLAETLGVEPARTDKKAKLYTESQFQAICAGLVHHIEGVAKLAVAVKA